MINSDLPDPVIPAISPWGPWDFSCKSNLKRSPDLSTPTGAWSVLVGSLVFQRLRIFNWLTIPILYISKNEIVCGKFLFSRAISIGILAIILQTSYMFKVSS